jgi:hypothetical protein
MPDCVLPNRCFLSEYCQKRTLGQRAGQGVMRHAKSGEHEHLRWHGRPGHGRGPARARRPWHVGISRVICLAHVVNCIVLCPNVLSSFFSRNFYRRGVDIIYDPPSPRLPGPGSYPCPSVPIRGQILLLRHQDITRATSGEIKIFNHGWARMGTDKTLAAGASRL